MRLEPAAFGSVMKNRKWTEAPCKQRRVFTLDGENLLVEQLNQAAVITLGGVQSHGGWEIWKRKHRHWFRRSCKCYKTQRERESIRMRRSQLEIYKIILSSLTRFTHVDPGQQRVTPEADDLVEVKVREAHAPSLCQPSLSNRAPPLGLNLLHGGSAGDLSHGLHSRRHETKKMLTYKRGQNSYIKVQ